MKNSLEVKMKTRPWFENVLFNEFLLLYEKRWCIFVVNPWIDWKNIFYNASSSFIEELYTILGIMSIWFIFLDCRLYTFSVRFLVIKLMRNYLLHCKRIHFHFIGCTFWLYIFLLANIYMYAILIGFSILILFKGNLNIQ